MLRLIFKRVNMARRQGRSRRRCSRRCTAAGNRRRPHARVETMQWGELSEEDVVDALKSVTGTTRASASVTASALGRSPGRDGPQRQAAVGDHLSP